MALNNKKRQSILQLLLFLGIVLLINIVANSRINGWPLFKKWDLTEEKRFTLTDATKNLLYKIDDVVSIKILLAGSFPAGFKRLQNAILETLDDFRGESYYIEYLFEDPNEGTIEQINQTREELQKDGIVPTRLNIQDSDGRSEKYIYPWAVVTYKGRSIPVNLLESTPVATPEQSEYALNQSIALLEYKLADALEKLSLSRKPVIVFTTGHGELAPVETASLEYDLRKYYETGRIHLDSMVAISNEASAVIVAKPHLPFSEKDKFKLDQYIMNGGKVMWLLDKINVDLDSLLQRQYLPVEFDLNLDDLLFTYGVRIQPNLLLDMQCSMIPLQTGMQGGKRQLELFPYPYHLVATSNSNHPVLKGLGPINLHFASSIDTSVQVKSNLEKTVVLHTTPNTRMQLLPIQMDFQFLRYEMKPEQFNKGEQITGLLIEGVFPSMYRNRAKESFLEAYKEIGLEFRKESTPNSMMVVADGDLAKNPINPRSGLPEPLGRNPYDRFTYSNKNFLMNAIEYLLHQNGVVTSRSKEVKLRLLDETRAKAEKTKWQFVNLGLPLIFITLFGFFYNWVRKRRFAR